MPTSLARVWAVLGLFLGGTVAVSGGMMLSDDWESHARTDRALRDLAAGAAQYGGDGAAHERARALILRDAPSTMSWLVGAGLVLVGIFALVAMLVAAWRASRAHLGAMVAHRARSERLVTTWARVVRTETVGSQTHEDRLTHYELALELDAWLEVASGYRAAHHTALRWNVRWPIEAAAAGHVVPGVYFGVAYDRAAPDQADATIPQVLVTLAGAVLPLR